MSRLELLLAQQSNKRGLSILLFEYAKAQLIVGAQNKTIGRLLSRSALYKRIVT